MKTPPLRVSHRFAVTFTTRVAQKLPSAVQVPIALNMGFQRVSGLSRDLSVRGLQQGGDNISVIHLPEHVNHGTLVLERGMSNFNAVSMLFDDAMGTFSLRYMTVVVLLLNHKHSPVCSWTACDAFPVRWQTSDLDASTNVVMIETLELAYRKLSWRG
jgi:phage tail-like protein